MGIYGASVFICRITTKGAINKGCQITASKIDSSTRRCQIIRKGAIDHASLAGSFADSTARYRTGITLKDTLFEGILG
jgi:hypothetical protein